MKKLLINLSAFLLLLKAPCFSAPGAAFLRLGLKRFNPKGVLSLLTAVFLFAVNPVHALLVHNIPEFYLDTSRTNIQSAGSGNWSSPSTWVGGVVPGAGHVVHISAGHTVTVDNTSAEAYTIGVHGTLRFNPAVNTRLIVTNLLVTDNPFGHLEIGTQTSPIDANVTAEIVIRNSATGSGVSDPESWGTAVIVLGKVTIQGAARTPTFIRLAAEPRTTQNTLTLSQAPSGWRVGDRVGLPDSREASEAETFANMRGQGEDAVITAINGTQITVNRNWTYNHDGARNAAGAVDFYPHVGNLSRNVIIRSEVPGGTRGHFICVQRADVNVQNALFKDLGRTTNSGGQLGRYALHMHHLMGPVNPGNTGYQFRLIGNAVTDGTKWPITIHQSHYGLIQDNVVYLGQGAGIVTEDGNESYNEFVHNFGMNISGDANPRDQDGRDASVFWLKGFNNYFRNNVAAGSFNTFQGIVSGSGYNFTWPPASAANTRIPLRRGADVNGGAQGVDFKLVNMQLNPIPEFSGNEAYGAMAAGMVIWTLGTNGYTTPAMAETVIRDYTFWHAWEEGFFGYPINKVTFDGFVGRGAGRAASWQAGYTSGDYKAIDVTIRRTNLQGLRTGIDLATATEGTFTIENSFLQNRGSNIAIPTLATPGTGASVNPRTTVVRNVNFERWPGATSYRTISMGWTLSRANSHPNVSDTVYVYDYDQTPGLNFRVYYAEQATQNIAGGLAPCNDTTTRPEINGITCPMSGPQLPSASITASPASITSGQSSTLNWSASSATTVSIDQGIGAVAASGSRTVSPTADTTYTLTAANSAGSITRSATVTVGPAVSPPTITAHPQNQNVTVGQNAAFSVTASGTGTLTYQWQSRPSGSSIFSNITGATSVNYTYTNPQLSASGMQFRCVVTNSAGSVPSNAAILTVTATLPTITQHPLNQSVTEGQTTTFSVSASGTPPLTYQWQSRASAAGAFSNITGANSSSYNTPATNLGNNGMQFRCQVSNSAGSVNSNPAALTVAAMVVPPSIITNPQSQSVTDGQTASFSVAVSGSQPLTYQWQNALPGSSTFNNVAEGTGASYVIPTATTAYDGHQYRVRVSNSAGAINSAIAILSVTVAVVAPTIQAHPQNAAATVGQDVIFQVSASGSQPLSYQWQRALGASPFSDIAGANNSDFTLISADLADHGARFHCVVSNSAGSVTSNAASLTVAADTTAPAVSAVSASAATTISAIISFLTDEAATHQVLYGPTTGYGFMTPVSPSLVTNHSQPLTGLSADTLYHYQVRALDAAGNAGMSLDSTFRTLATPDTVAPVISGVVASGATSSGITINFQTDEPATRRIEYGLTPAYGTLTPLNSTFATSHSAGLLGLSAATLYHYRVHAQDASENPQVSGDFTFTTLALPLPMGNLSASLMTVMVGQSTTLSWTTTDAASVSIDQGIGAVGASGSISVSPSVTTTYTLTAANATGPVTSQVRILVTPLPDTTAPVISSVTISAITASEAAINLQTNESATLEIEYGPSAAYGSMTPHSMFMTSHSEILTGLAADTLYHFRINAKDAANNLRISNDLTFRTLPAGGSTPPPAIFTHFREILPPEDPSRVILAIKTNDPAVLSRVTTGQLQVTVDLPSGPRPLTLNQVAGDPNAFYVLVSSTSLTGADRALTQGTNITLTIGGAAITGKVEPDVVSSAFGGKVVSGKVTVLIKAGGMKGEGQLMIMELMEDEARRKALAKANLILIGTEVDFMLSSGSLSAATLSIPMDMGLVPSGRSPAIYAKMAYYNPATKSWEVQDNANIRGEQMESNVAHFSIYAPVMQMPASTGEFKEGYIYPNPASSGDTPVIRVKMGQVEEVKIDIYDVSGRRVHSASFPGEGPAIGTDEEYYYEYRITEKLASGTYIAAIRGKTSTATAKGKIKFTVVK